MPDFGTDASERRASEGRAKRRLALFDECAAHVENAQRDFGPVRHGQLPRIVSQ